jgi:hypothetical protein
MVQPDAAARGFIIGMLIFSLLSLLAEVLTTPPTADAHEALRWILGPMGGWFWAGGIGLGHLLPLVLLATGSSALAVIAALATLAGLYVIERLWVLAPQQVPLS